MTSENEPGARSAEIAIKKALQDLMKTNFDFQAAYDPPEDPEQKRIYDDIFNLGRNIGDRMNPAT